MKRFLLAIALAACGGKGKTAEAPMAPEPETDTAPAPVPAAAGAACVDDCAGRYPGAAQVAGYRAYCEEVCTPPSEPSAPCVASCEKSHEPGARYDDGGEYVADEDLRDEAQKQADRDACEGECATVPEVSEAGMAACVSACTADGRNESACQAECDPDPYDQCRYAPCD